MEWLTRYTLSGVTYTVHFEWSELHSTLRVEWLTQYTSSGVTYTVHFEWSDLHSTLRVEWLTQYYTSSGESDSVISAFESRNRYPLEFTSRVFALFETGYIEWSNFFSNDNYQQYTHIYVYIASIHLLDLHWSIMKMKMKPNINMYKKLSANILILLWTRFEIYAGIFDNLCLFQKQDGPERFPLSTEGLYKDMNLQNSKTKPMPSDMNQTFQQVQT